MEKTYFIIPAYNEAENITELVREWYPVVEQADRAGEARLVIINDGSTDATYQILCRCAAERPLLIPLTKPNGGHGSAVLYGYRYAIRHGADYIFQTDSDRQTDPAEFRKFWKLRHRYDAVIGYRYDRQDGAFRVFTEKVLLAVIKIVFGVMLPDANAPYRLMRADLVRKYIHIMPHDFNLPNALLTAFFAYCREPVRFVRISFRPRQKGNNSVNAASIIRIGRHAAIDFIRLKKKLRDSQKNIDGSEGKC